MDPNQTLKDLRKAVESLNNPGATSVDVEDVAENFEALDNWLTQGGFPPAAWVPTEADLADWPCRRPGGCAKREVGA